MSARKILQRPLGQAPNTHGAGTAAASPQGLSSGTELPFQSMLSLSAVPPSEPEVKELARKAYQESARGLRPRGLQRTLPPPPLLLEPHHLRGLAISGTSPSQGRQCGGLAPGRPQGAMGRERPPRNATPKARPGSACSHRLLRPHLRVWAQNDPGRAIRRQHRGPRASRAAPESDRSVGTNENTRADILLSRSQLQTPRNTTSPARCGHAAG